MALSARASQAAREGKTAVKYQVLENLWHPSDNKGGFINLGLAENTLLHGKLGKHIHEHVNLTSAQFTYGNGNRGSFELRRIMARFLNRHFSPARPIEMSHISVTNGCAAAIEHLAWGIANPGEAFLLGRPYYGKFLTYPSVRTAANLVPVSFGEVDPFSIDAVAFYESALLEAERNGQRIAGLILCNPHNPLGRCYSRETVIALMKLCQKYRLHLVSDEIYALSVWENNVDQDTPLDLFTSCLSIEPTGIIDPDRVHVVWGMSKDFGANGMRLGAIISQANETFHRAMVEVCVHSAPSSLAEQATARMLEEDDWIDVYIAENRRILALRYEMAVDWARRNGIVYMPGVNAAFFLWVDLGTSYRQRQTVAPDVDIDDAIVSALLKQKVFLASGKAFGAETPGWFRIVFSNEEHVLQEGLKRIIASLDPPSESEVLRINSAEILSDMHEFC